MSEKYKIDTVGVIGLGYVGLPLALALVKSGYDVIGVDIDEQRVNQLQNGSSYIGDISDAEVSRAIERGFESTTEYNDLREVDGVSICVPTPLRKSGQPDVSYVVDASERLTSILSEGCTVVLESTVYPSATEEVIAEQFEENGWEVGKDVFVAFSPERIDPGNEQYGVQDIPKVVGGVTEPCGDHAVALYEPVFDEVVRVASSSEAEFVKLLENTFRGVNIGLINELAVTANSMNIDIWDAIDAAATKPFGYMPFYPGPGLGGHCIPIDPQYLSWKAKQHGLETRFIDLADRINRQMPKHVVNEVTALLNKNGLPVLDSEILILGAAYKADVSDTRESPAIDIIDLLQERGANIKYHDPHVDKITTREWRLESIPLTTGLLQEQDCVIIVTNHSDIDLSTVVECSSLIFDTRNATGTFSEQSHIYRI